MALGVLGVLGDIRPESSVARGVEGDSSKLRGVLAGREGATNPAGSGVQFSRVEAALVQTVLYCSSHENLQH